MMAGRGPVQPPSDTLLAALPLSFELSQLTIAALPAVVLAELAAAARRAQGDRAQTRERADGGAAAVDPARAIALGRGRTSTCYIANTGGRMPGGVLARLRAQLPSATPS